MNFLNFHNLRENKISSDKDARFIANANNEEEWVPKIMELVDITESCDINKEIMFYITDTTNNFIIKLKYLKDGKFGYAIEKSSIEWAESNGITMSNYDENGFGIDAENKTFVYKNNEYKKDLKRIFSADELNQFINILFSINEKCESVRNFTLIQSLYYVDDFSTREAEAIRKCSTTSRWLKYTLKGDMFRKKDRFSFF